MEELKIVGWTDFDSDYPTPKVDSEKLRKYLDLIYAEIIKNGYVFSGEEHQYSSTGVPVFSDGTCFRASMRAWGSIMANVYSDPKGEKMTYMDFYMSLGSDSVLPPFKKINVKPQKGVDPSCGCTIIEDRQIIEEAKSYGMTFMTTDKVLKKMTE